MQPVLTLTQQRLVTSSERSDRPRAPQREGQRGDQRATCPAIVGEEAIITADGNKIVKVPIRSLELPRFRFGQNDQDQVGQGQGGSRAGDIVGQTPSGNAPGPGSRAPATSQASTTTRPS